MLHATQRSDISFYSLSSSDEPVTNSDAGSTELKFCSVSINQALDQKSSPESPSVLVPQTTPDSNGSSRPPSSSSGSTSALRRKQHACDSCSAAFGSKMELEEHQNSHTGEKPFVCEVCHARFNRRSTLWNHKRIHSDDKPFECPICEMHFKWKNSLKCHTEMHVRKNETGPLDLLALQNELTPQRRGRVKAPRRSKKQQQQQQLQQQQCNNMTTDISASLDLHQTGVPHVNGFGSPPGANQQQRLSPPHPDDPTQRHNGNGVHAASILQAALSNPSYHATPQPAHHQYQPQTTMQHTMPQHHQPPQIQMPQLQQHHAPVISQHQLPAVTSHMQASMPKHANGVQSTQSLLNSCGPPSMSALLGSSNSISETSSLVSTASALSSDGVQAYFLDESLSNQQPCFAYQPQTTVHHTNGFFTPNSEHQPMIPQHMACSDYMPNVDVMTTPTHEHGGMNLGGLGAGQAVPVGGAGHGVVVRELQFNEW